MIEALLPVLLPVILCAGLGFAWTRLGTPLDPIQVRTVVTSFGTPCLIFATLVKLEVSAQALATMGVTILLALALFAALGVTMLAFARLPARIYLAPLVFGNLGNLGLPLCLFAFGQVGLELGIVAFAIQSVIFFTLGAWLISGRTSPSAFLRAPQPYAVAAALAFTLTDTAPPAWLFNTTDLLAGMTIPLMLITLGISLGKLGVVRLRRTLGLGALRLALGVAVGLFLAHALALDGPARGVTIILCSMPSAVFNYLLALHFRQNPEEVASLVVATTLGAFLILPGVLFIAMS
ncbi:MAG: AEC family transporter [Alphaproteobacteria bacterium]|nr:AEC family transporter [Alphaproteobacteria bacterium]